MKLRERRYWKAVVLGILVLVGVVAFWFGLGSVLRTSSPLMPMDSTTMTPSLNYGDLIAIAGVTDFGEINAQPMTGDIIVFQKPSEPNTIVVRRAVDKTLNGDVWYIQTQADINGLPDPWESGQNPEDVWGDGFFHQKFVMGKVVGKIPLLGYFPLMAIELVRTPAALLLLIALMFLVIFVKHSSSVKKVKPLSLFPT